MKFPVWGSMLATFTVLILISCGGGGGDGASPGAATGSISYTGQTTKAIIGDTNAEDLAVTSYQGGSAGSSMGSFASVSGVGGPSVERSHAFDLVQVLQEVAGQIEVDLQGPVIGAAMATESMTMDGDCGGSATYTASYDEQTGMFSGSLHFTEYCSAGVTLSGSSSFSGSIDPQTSQMAEFSFSFDNYTVASGNDSFSCSGSIAFDMSALSQTASVNMYLKDGSTDEVYRLEDFVMSATDYDSYVEMAITSGNFYHPDYGYIALATTAPFRAYFSEDWPSAGELVCTGETVPGGGPTKARLTVISSTEYQIEADTNGDGTYDYNSGNLPWSNV